MKQYTEEQVMEAYNAGIDDGNWDRYKEDIVALKLTPIELPSRDMADKAALNNSVESKIDFLNGFIWTCSRIREQIN